MRRFSYSSFLALTLTCLRKQMSILAAAALLFPPPTQAQNPEWMNFTVRNTGLPSDLVTALAVEGNIWIGTDGEGMASGVYFYQLRAGDFVGMRRMLVLK